MENREKSHCCEENCCCRSRQATSILHLPLKRIPAVHGVDLTVSSQEKFLGNRSVVDQLFPLIGVLHGGELLIYLRDLRLSGVPVVVDFGRVAKIVLPENHC